MISKSNFDQIAESIAEKLNESNQSAINQIKKLIDVAGEAFANTYLEKTLEIEAQGGLSIEGEDNSQRRTPGGVFFYLIKQNLSEEEMKVVFPSKPKKKKPRPPIEVSPQAQLFAHQAVGKLKDDNPQNKETIGKIAQVCGVELSQSVLDTVTDIESQDGLRRTDGTRRSSGEAFLYIASRRMTVEQRNQVWPVLPEELRPPKTKQTTLSIPKPKRSPSPDGVATTAKLTLIGRPETVERRPGFVSFLLKNMRPPGLPSGLPHPDENTFYRVYVQDKQWDRVSNVLSNPNDSLLIEGFPALDKDQKIAVFASIVKSRFAKKSNPFSYR